MPAPKDFEPTVRRATAVPQTYRVLSSGTLPDGEQYLTIGVIDYSGYVYLPDAVTFEGKTYGKTGWNSDLQEAYYKAGAKLATAITR